MIPKYIVQQWKSNAPWQSESQVEHDLILTRALISLYQNSTIRENLAFRGGTALNKIFIDPPARYSEDLDFVLINDAPVGEILSAIRDSSMIKSLALEVHFEERFHGFTLNAKDACISGFKTQQNFEEGGAGGTTQSEDGDVPQDVLEKKTSCCACQRSMRSMRCWISCTSASSSVACAMISYETMSK